MKTYLAVQVGYQGTFSKRIEADNFQEVLTHCQDFSEHWSDDQIDDLDVKAYGNAESIHHCLESIGWTKIYEACAVSWDVWEKTS